jgi:AraC family transcriptional activator of pobA
MAIKLEFCRVVTLSPPRVAKWHTHGALELVYYVEGTGTSKIARETHRLARGVFTITPAGVYHDQKNRTEVTSICLGLTGSGLEEHPGAWSDPGGAIGTACRRLVAELEEKRPRFELVTDGLVEEIVGLAARVAVEGERPAGGKGLVDRAISVIRDQGGTLSVAELADRLYVSRDYLRHLFRDYGGMSPMQHIIRARVEKAKDLLTDPELTVGQVAARSGFESPYYFSRFFKKETGVSPSQYRAGLSS